MDHDAEDDDGLTEEERQRRQALEYDETDEPAMQITKEERVAQIELANYAVPLGGKVWHARLPNFLSLDRNVFDEKTWTPPAEPDASQNEDEAAARKAPVPDENVMRWRWTQDELSNFVS
jgi:RNA polymerase-associated protein LEO1